jgi:glyoxylate/hydroxypyruvate reductase A
VDLLFHTSSGDPAAWPKALATHLPEARVHRAPSAVACDYALVWKPAPGTFASQSRLRAVFNIGAGVDALLADPELPDGVPIVRLEDAGMAAQMVEYVAWGVLHHYRRFADYAAQQARQEWRPRAARRPADFGVGVLGLGVLGRAIAAGLAPFGFRIAGWSRTPRTCAGVECHAGEAALDAFLARCDVLVCLLPATPATRGLLCAERFARLPRGAFVINVARGALVVEQDLLEALDSGQVGGALLDVFAHEPLPSGHPFWRHPRITVTPHVSAATLVDESIAQIAAKIRALARGEPITGVVDRALAY